MLHNGSECAEPIQILTNSAQKVDNVIPIGRGCVPQVFLE